MKCFIPREWSLTLALAFGAIVLSACAKSGTGSSVHLSASTDIIGGSVVNPALPFAHSTVYLVDQTRNISCSGNVISQRWILTAAHCVNGTVPQNLAIYFVQNYGSQSSNTSLKSTVRSFFVNPGYVQVMTRLHWLGGGEFLRGRSILPAEYDRIQDWGDIALLELDGVIPATASAVELADSTQALSAGAVLLAAGFGVSRGRKPIAGGGILREVTVAVSHPIWGRTEFLVGEQFAGPCHGDSGGPAFFRDGGSLRLVGIASREVFDDQDICHGEMAFTYVSSYLPWIHFVTGDARL